MHTGILDTRQVRATMARTGLDALDTPVSDGRFAANRADSPMNTSNFRSPPSRTPTSRTPTSRTLALHPHAEDSPIVPKSLLKGANRRRIASSDEEEEQEGSARKGFMSDSDSDDEALVAKADFELSEEEQEEEEEESFASAEEPSSRPDSRVDLVGHSKFFQKPLFLFFFTLIYWFV